MEQAEIFLRQMHYDTIIECIDEAYRLAGQIAPGIGLGQPYYLVLDNDVLIALQKPHDYQVRYVALILLFRALDSYTKCNAPTQ